MLLQPLANIAASIYALRGTECHAGGDGEDDQTVAERLGARGIAHTWRLRIAGRLLDWAHHGVTIPRDPWCEANGLFAEAKRHQARFEKWKVPKPDLVVRHHAHFSPPPVTDDGITVAVCPCWQTSTAYGYRRGPERRPDIGALVWHPAEHTIERLLYPLEQSETNVTFTARY
jgi:hypothetical protein